jgi:quercetin dioxygenase-like cupin family protein
MSRLDLAVNPVHLGLGASAQSEPAFTGSMDWYASYVDRHAADGVEGRLVSTFTFKEPWNLWEMHPHGAEVVLCLEGGMTLHQERTDGSRRSVQLQPGEYAINEPGTWHTADVEGESTALFITAGAGTQHRPR